MNVALRSERLNIISLCSGGGGLDLGVELAMPGARSVVLVEREAFACAHLVSAMQQGLMAPAALWSDVTTFNGRPWRGLVDGLIGGIPCQPHSLAGKRLGEDDERDLWSDARRIIVQSGCWFVVIENVRGMLSSGGAERVWRDLRRLGFAVEAGLFTAAEVRASHDRERVFILAVADYANRRWSHAPAPGGSYGSARPLGGRGCELADADDARLEGHRKLGQRARERAAWSGGGELAVVDATSERRREGRPEPELRSGRHTSTSSGPTMDDASIARSRGLSVQPWRQDETGTHSDRPSLFPPGPSESHRWRDALETAPELEPSVCRVADGLASRMDTARVDRLRLLGNGVVSLQAAYALRTLATRLAASGSAGAARLVRMMEASE